jgi:hypothetical protein
MSDMDSNETASTPSSEEAFTAPYTSFSTFLRYIEQMKEEGGAPSRIDRSYLSKLPGGAQTIFIASCKTLDLIDDGMHPTKALENVIDATPEDRKILVAELVRKYYAGPLALGSRATQAQLEDEFRKMGVTGSTLRKAVGFYLNALKYAGITYSSNFKLPKIQTNGTRKRKTGRKGEPDDQPSSEEDDETPPGGRSDLPTLIEGLIEKLPADGAGWTANEAKQWLDIAKLTFPFVYGYKDGDPIA